MGSTIAVPTSKFLTSADGTQIYASAVGDCSKPAVVLIHGFSFSSIVFDSLFTDTRWTDRVFLVRYDVRGHGRSGMPEDEESWSSARLSEDFDAVINAFGLSKPFVAGWSLGGAHITDVMTFHPPTYILGIIYIAALPYLAAQLQVASPHIKTSTLPSFMQTNDVNSFQTAALDFVSILTRCPDAVPYELQQALLGNIMTQPRAVTPLVVLRTQDEQPLLEAGRGGLPLLVVFGTEDMIVVGSEIVKAVNGWKNLEVVEIPDVGHMPWLEANDVFRGKVLGWVERIVNKFAT